MPGLNNDRLEQFFRKATNRPQLTFSEEDWKKLEARLDAADAERLADARTPKKIITASVAALFLLSMVGIWWGTSEDSSVNMAPSEVATSLPALPPLESATELQQRTTEDLQSNDEMKRLSTVPEGVSPSGERIARNPSTDDETSAPDETSALDEASALDETGEGLSHAEGVVSEGAGIEEEGNDDRIAVVEKPLLTSDGAERNKLVKQLSTAQVRHELTELSPMIAERNAIERNKQRAPIELPGAEEADIAGRQTMVEEEHASYKKEHVARPRLSLLLSFAPDFSGTSLGRYSAPGKAYGAVIHYHLKSRWSVSAGVIKNNKTYTGAGEDYTPPNGYWKYYTNGVIPESIDGSCSVLEFPLMVQYVLSDRRQNRWIVGAGTSSYIMQSESYRYHFDQPNPGAREGWNSRGSSRFLFNMLNLTVAYERQVIPGLMLGIEPYVKLPLEKIGWSSLKLYSSGASVTLRYTLIGRKHMTPGTFRSRGPD